MPTEKQIQALRANGARSKGPVTPAGKQKSSLSSTRHGLLCRSVVLAEESPEGIDVTDATGEYISYLASYLISLLENQPPPGYDCTVPTVNWADVLFIIPDPDNPAHDGMIYAYDAVDFPYGTDPLWTATLDTQLITPGGTKWPAMPMPAQYVWSPGFGFGPYQSNFYATIVNNYCANGNTLEVDSQVQVPPPHITSLAPNAGVIGTVVSGIVVNGIGLDDLYGYDADGNEVNGVAGFDIQGVTAVQVTQNGQPTAITGYVQSQTGGTATITLDLTAAGVTAGNYDVQLRVFGYITPANPADTFTVVDTTPYISSVTPLAPLYPNGQASVEIFGTNFGPACPGNSPCPGAGISICQDGSPDPCVPTGTNVDVGSQITYWSGSQVNALLSAGSAASGYYDIVLTSAGSAGQLGMGFVAPPGTLGGGSASNRARTPVNPPNLNLQVQVNVNGTNQPLTAGQCAYISAVPNPQMPQITATIANQNNVPVSSGTATWTLNSTFLYTTKNSSGVPYQATEQNSAPLSSTQTTATWTAGSFSSIFGGNAEIDWTYTAPGGSAQAGNPFHFPICGQNPDPTTSVVTALSVPSPMNNRYWFAPNIAIHETNLSQFCSSTVSASYCVNNPQAVALGLRVFGTPAGYGVMQLDPVPAPPPAGTSDALWNWHTNVTGGLATLDALAYNPPPHLGGYLFWQNQVSQWLSQDTNAPNDAPSEAFPAPASCTFVAPVSPFTRQGQAVQSVPGNPPNKYWFGDAEVMKQYAGGTLNYIYWDNVSVPNVHEATFTWLLHRVSLPGHNAPYEFCTCSSSSSCQHTTPKPQLMSP